MCTGSSDGTAGEAEQHAPTMENIVMEKSSWGYVNAMKFQASMMDETLRQEVERARKEAYKYDEIEYVSDYMNVNASVRGIEGETDFKNVDITVNGDRTNTILTTSIADKFVSDWENKFTASVYFSKSGEDISLSRAEEIYKQQ